ncbi:hypothetical protein E3N88_41688 [Mikania micrantha]|uniref:Uncharacterized protein n=1 Tax=Mikania micrantha TaxID=192012 RepID=A0A5N6LM68_9ASTR|nr:hypothetical protein E3N88_41688 [Mikania micrantha]
MIKQRQPASSKNGSVIVTIERDQLGENFVGNNPMNWTKLVMDMYPPGTSVSLQEQSIAMIVTDVFYSLITIVFGWEHALARAIIVVFGGTFLRKQPYVFGPVFCILTAYKLNLIKHGMFPCDPTYYLETVGGCDNDHSAIIIVNRVDFSSSPSFVS